MPPIDLEYVSRRIEQFLRKYLARSSAHGYVLGVSGGIDSAVVLALLVRALGPSKVVALIMPDPEVTPREDLEDALSLVESYGVEHYVIEIDRVVKAFAETLPFFDPSHNLATGNLRARVRMCMLYYYANRFNMLVAGTSDKSEILLGYFTKYGDGGADVLPLGDLYKTYVRQLGAWLGIPKRIVEKPSRPGLWPGHLAEEELGAKYEVIDAILYRYVELLMDVDEIAQEIGVDRKLVESIVRRIHLNEHKRKMPPIPRVSRWCVYHDWRMPVELEV